MIEAYIQYFQHMTFIELLRFIGTLLFPFIFAGLIWLLTWSIWNYFDAEIKEKYEKNSKKVSKR